MAKHRTQITLDEDLYFALKKLPREISVSNIINTLLKLMLEEAKLGREMTKEEVNEWIRKDPKLIKGRQDIRDSIGPYIDSLYEVLDKFKKGK